tara:strand:- start:323 stop:766 length:444 start_codon:yes stop_codon:yes gene_type:complete
MKEFLQDWFDFLQKPNKSFDGMPPCPFAKSAFQRDKIEIVEYKNILTVIEYMMQPWEKKVVIFVMQDYGAAYLQWLAIKLGIMYPDFIFLEDHPDLEENINGQNMNSGKVLLLVQERKELEEARRDLMKTKYYDKWTLELKQRIFDR